ncbi:MAG: hypothetical protein JXA96_15285 [Sedimentisphaerales bacterium]|nr:hypothetical protein [Sedimentisphaerales bacterium]
MKKIFIIGLFIASLMILPIAQSKQDKPNFGYKLSLNDLANLYGGSGPFCNPYCVAGVTCPAYTVSGVNCRFCSSTGNGEQCLGVLSWIPDYDGCITTAPACGNGNYGYYSLGYCTQESPSEPLNQYPTCTTKVNHNCND